MVSKPSEKVPLSAIVLADVLYEAGLPPEMYQVVTGDPKEIADELITNPDVDLVTFTGGVADRQVHRLEGRLPAHGARARRQRSDHRHGRRRPRRGEQPRRRRLVQELGPALHRRQAHAGAGIGGRPLRRDAGREDEGLELRRPDGRQARHGHRDRRGGGALLRRQGERSGIARARACSSATSAAARSTRRRSSTTSSARCRWCCRRPSARSRR